MSFWEVVWFIVISFAFVAYLMVLFSIIGDLFRDRDLAGWAKGLWIVALIFVPLLTALVYLIVRGRGMAERQISSYEDARRAQDAYIREVAGPSTSTPADEIAKAKAMYDEGTISREEFDALKSKALGLTPAPRV